MSAGAGGLQAFILTVSQLSSAVGDPDSPSLTMALPHVRSDSASGVSVSRRSAV